MGFEVLKPELKEALKDAFGMALLYLAGALLAASIFSLRDARVKHGNDSRAAPTCCAVKP